jgi:hypothetical protein
MKLTTIALAVAFTVPSTLALAQNGVYTGSHVTRPFALPAGGARIPTRSANISGNTLLPVAHDPSGSTLTGSAVNRTGG